MLKVYTPYRVCPIGAHVDHQHGIVTGFALDRGVRLTCEPTSDGSIEIESRNFGGCVKTSARRTTSREMHWGDYARSAVAALINARYDLEYGIKGDIEGTLPIGGLSSSAAVILTYIRALCEVNNIRLNKSGLVELGHWAETKYIGLSNGVLDQSCEVYSRKDHLLYLDTNDNKYELIPKSPTMPDYEIMIVFSGLEHALIHSDYNARVDECRAAAYAMFAYSGMPYGKISEAFLRDVPDGVFEKYADMLPDTWRRRAEHYYAETARVKLGTRAWMRGDLNAFGRLMFESGTSSIELYEAGSDELKALHEIALATDGVYGGRFCGAGFKGCYVALTDPAYRDEIVQKFTDSYLSRFPDLKNWFEINFCESADGVYLK